MFAQSLVLLPTLFSLASALVTPRSLSCAFVDTQESYLEITDGTTSQVLGSNANYRLSNATAAVGSTAGVGINPEVVISANPFSGANNQFGLYVPSLVHRSILVADHPVGS